MKISKRSWHYRLLRWMNVYDSNMPRDLCGYVAQLTVLVLLFFPIAAIFFIPVAIIGSIGMWLFPKPKLLGETLFGQWFEARKRQVCPLIEYQDAMEQEA